MEKLHELKRKACEALDDIAGDKSLNLMNMDHRKVAYELVEILKDICKIEMSEGGQSEMGYGGEWAARGSSRGSYGGGYSHGSYSGGSSRGRSRDSMGRYSSGGSHEDMLGCLEEMLEMAPDSRTAEKIRRLKMEMEQG